LLALKEKQIEFQSCYVSLNKFEQHEDWFKAINPMGQVPVIVHDGKVITNPPSSTNTSTPSSRARS